MRQLRQSGVLILALMTGSCPRQIGKRLKSENGLKKYNEGFAIEANSLAQINDLSRV